MEKSLEMLASQQQSIQKNFQQAVSNNPFTATMNELTEQNMEAWRQLQNNFFKATGFTGPDPKNKE